MPKLIILDLSGNSLCTEGEDYREYTIFHVRRLKVLDGMGVEVAEQESAKDKYEGKLTLDFVIERGAATAARRPTAHHTHAP